MARGNAWLKIAGLVMALFGILQVLWAMVYGFLGAKSISESQAGSGTLIGLLIFYGIFGIMVGLFQLGVCSLCIRSANTPEHWKRCLVWGIVILILGIFNLCVLLASSGMMDTGNEFYPSWFGFAIVIVGGIVLPLIMIIGSILNKTSVKGTQDE